jgi:hypothetical protein
MRNKSKGITLLLVAILTAASIVMVESVSAQSTHMPSAPEFTVKYVDLSYNTQAVYGIDQYTGKNVVKEESQHIDNRSLQFTIKNQPFTPLPELSGNLTGLFFNFRIKGAYGTEWDYYPFALDGQSTNTYGGPFVPLDERPPAPAFSQSSTEYTTVTIKIPEVYNIPSGAPLEVQVQAIAGGMWYQDKQYHFSGESSDWSSSQIVTVGESLASSIPSPTTTLKPTAHQTAAPTATPASTATSGDTASGTISLPTTTFALIISAFTVLIVALLLLLFIRHRKATKVSVI